MKRLLILITLTTLGLKSYSQSYDRKPIAIQDIEKGITDFDYFRPILLENKFRLNEKENQSEYWRVPVDGQQYLCQVCIQVSSWRNDDKEFGRTIFIQIRKDLLPKYAQDFMDNVKSYYPEKKAEAIRTRTGTSKEKDNYRLIYYRKGSKIEIEFDEDEDETWTKCYFRLNLI